MENRDRWQAEFFKMAGQEKIQSRVVCVIWFTQHNNSSVKTRLQCLASQVFPLLDKLLVHLTRLVNSDKYFVKRLGKCF